MEKRKSFLKLPSREELVRMKAQNGGLPFGNELDLVLADNNYVDNNYKFHAINGKYTTFGFDNNGEFKRHVFNFENTNQIFLSAPIKINLNNKN